MVQWAIGKAVCRWWERTSPLGHGDASLARWRTSRPRGREPCKMAYLSATGAVAQQKVPWTASPYLHAIEHAVVTREHRFCTANQHEGVVFNGVQFASRFPARLRPHVRQCPSHVVPALAEGQEPTPATSPTAPTRGTQPTPTPSLAGDCTLDRQGVCTRTYGWLSDGGQVAQPCCGPPGAWCGTVSLGGMRVTQTSMAGVASLVDSRNLGRSAANQFAD